MLGPLAGVRILSPLAEGAGTGVNARWDGLIASWKLDETSGTRTEVLSGYPLSDYNTVGYAAAPSGNAAAFVRASSEYLQSAATISLPAAWTFSGWVYAADTTTSAAFYIGTTTWTANVQLAIYVGGTTLRALVASTAADYSNAATPSAVATGAWHHVCAWFNNAGDRKAYIAVDDGTVYAGSALTGTYCNGTARAITGGYGNATVSYWNGRIWNCSLFTGALGATAGWRTDMYNSGNGQLYPN